MSPGLAESWFWVCFGLYIALVHKHLRITFSFPSLITPLSPRLPLYEIADSQTHLKGSGWAHLDWCQGICVLVKMCRWFQTAIASLKCGIITIRSHRASCNSSQLMADSVASMKILGGVVRNSRVERKDNRRSSFQSLPCHLLAMRLWANVTGRFSASSVELDP